MLADRPGKRLADTRFPTRVPNAAIQERRSFEAVVRTRAPVVGNLVKGLDGNLQFPIRVPVIRNGALRYVLTALITAEGILDVVQRQGLPDDWVISIFDANGLRVARSRADAENLGGLAAPSLQKLMAGGAAEGMGQTFSLEGNRIYTAYSRLKDSGWSAAPGLPAALVEGAAYRSLVVYGGGVVLSLGLAALAAIWVAGSINRPMHELHAAAQALGRGGRLKAPTTSIQEIREVADALSAAADERRTGEAQREEF